MKYPITVIALLFALTVASLQANSIILTKNEYSYDSGGEFNAHITGGQVSGYSKYTSSDSDFETFCLDASTYFTPGKTYTYSVSDMDLQGRYISQGTAFLYSEFAQGDLKGYKYSNEKSRLKDAGLLQEAIWYLQGGQIIDGITPTKKNNRFYAQAYKRFGALATDENSIYNVSVINLTDCNFPVQNQLVYSYTSCAPPCAPPCATVSERGNWLVSSMLLLPLGMVAMRRKLSITQ
jgi:hypothetical protein